jgi:FAD/FMN-containing dehydrogenase
LAELQSKLDGELRLDSVSQKLYSTDASAYQEIPLAVALPKNESDIKHLVEFANRNAIGLIPRTAGTSLAGQVVGDGIVVDVSRHFTKILEVNQAKGWVRVQPGVIRNELNLELAKFGLMFGPETSTSNRAMIGGMVGNNSCGSNSIVYGSTREHTLELRGFLSDGSEATFGVLSDEAFADKCESEDTLESSIYRGVQNMLLDQANRDEIEREFPKPEIKRRNTGYAIDLLAGTSPFNDSPFNDSLDDDSLDDDSLDDDSLDDDSATTNGPAERFNFCKLLAGSEGTLFFTTEIKLNCLPLPPPISGLLCVHFESVDEALRATQIAVHSEPFACELIDRRSRRGTGRRISRQG